MTMHHKIDFHCTVSGTSGFCFSQEEGIDSILSQTGTSEDVSTSKAVDRKNSIEKVKSTLFLADIQ